MRGPALGLVAALFASPALADAGPIQMAGQMTGLECRNSWSAIAGLFGPSDGTKVGDGPFVAGDGACEMRDVGFAQGGARRLRWRTDGVQALTGGQMPTAADVELLDLHFGGGSAKAGGGGWFLAAKSRVDGGFSLAWDASSQTMEIGQIFLTTGEGNRLALRANVNGLADGDLSALGPRLLTARITTLDLSVESSDLSALIAALPIRPAPKETTSAAHSPPDPLTEVEQSLAAALPDLPGAIFAPESQAALTGFVAALPHAAGRLDVHVDAPQGLVPASFALLGAIREPSPQDVFRLLTGSRVTIRWTPGG